MSEATATVDCPACSARASCFLQQVGDIRRAEPPRALYQSYRRRDLLRGDILFREGEKPVGVWLVCQGRLKIMKETADGKLFILRLAQPGTLVGYQAFAAGEVYGCRGVAMEPVQVIFLRRDYIEELLASNPGVALRLLRHLAEQLGETEKIATTMAYQRSRERVLGTLYKIAAEKLGIHKYYGGGLSIRRQDLASLAGLSVETTVRVLKDLERENVLTIQRRMIHLLDHDDFKRFAAEHLLTGVA